MQVVWWALTLYLSLQFFLRLFGIQLLHASPPHNFFPVRSRVRFEKKKKKRLAKWEKQEEAEGGEEEETEEEEGWSFHFSSLSLHIHSLCLSPSFA